MILNTAEGFGSRSRGVKRRHYEIARGSALECVAILDLAVALGLEGVPAAARALFTRAAMMLSKLEAGPADVVDRGVHTAALRSHCRKGLASGETFAHQAVEPGADWFGVGLVFSPMCPEPDGVSRELLLREVPDARLP